MPGVNSGAETSVSGSGGRAKEVLIDGGSNVSPESGGLSMQNIGFEAYNEFKMTTGGYSAELGRFGGGVEMFSTKSGTNQIHGGAFLGLRRDIFNAAGFVSNAKAGQKPGYRSKERYNELSVSVGGPVYIPKVYDGRNRTFFFFTYSRDMRPSTYSTGNMTLPTTAMLGGDFSALNTTIYDPATTVFNGSTYTRSPFAGNLIPKSSFSSVSSKFIGYIPTPTNSNLLSNFTNTSTSKYTNDIWTVKIDHQFTPSQRLAFFLQRFTAETKVADPIGALSGNSNGTDKPDQVRANYDWTLRPTMLLHTMFSYASTRQGWTTPLQNGFSSQIGLPNQGGNSDTAPYISLSDSIYSYSGFSQTNGSKVNNGGQWNYTYHLSGYLSWVHGKHEVKAGWEVRRLQTASVDEAATNGEFGFSNIQTAASSVDYTKSGNAWASLLLGQASSMTQKAEPVMSQEVRYGYHAGFIQDTWRVHPRVTLELGLRYEVPKGRHDKDGNYSMVDLNLANPGADNLPGAMVYGGYGAGRLNKMYFYPTDYSDVGPRLGGAWRITNKTVFRGGWGIYYQTLGNGGCGCTDGFDYTADVGSDGFNTFAKWDNPVPYPSSYTGHPQLSATIDNGTMGYTMGDSYGKAPRIYSWSASLQQEIKGWLFEVGYVGNRGHGLSSAVQLNQLPTGYLTKYGSNLLKSFNTGAAQAAGFSVPYANFISDWGSAATVKQALRKYPQYSDLDLLNSGNGQTWYDALQVKAERRKGPLLSMFNYTWSKSLSMLHYRQIFENYSYMAQDSFNLKDAKSYLPFHQAHVFSLLTSYDLPLGKNRRFLTGAGPVLNAIASGWSVSAAQKYYPGPLIRVAASSSTLGTYLGAITTKANATGKAIRTNLNRTDLEYGNTSKRYFNSGTDAPFTNPGTFELGTAAFYRNDFRQPEVMTENLSLLKAFTIAERFKFKFRADAFNIFNRTNFSVNSSWSSSTFGYATGVQTAPRMITLGLRLDF
jgi:hypothetical protein